MRNLKLSLGLHSFFLSFVGMFLTNLLVLIFWYGDVVYRESRGIEKYLEFIAREEGNRPLPASTGDQEMAGHFLLQEGMKADCMYKGTLQGWQESETCTNRLRQVLGAAARTGKTSRDISAIMPPSKLGNPSAYYAAATKSGEGHTLVAGVAIPQRYYTDRILEKEKTIFVYLLVNAIVFAVIVFFRLSSSILRPVDRLISLADSYQGDDKFDLSREHTGGELGHLTLSMQAMASRINKHRTDLQNNIKQLELANRELEENRREMVRTEKMAVIGRLAAGLGHEIGNPLGIVGGYLELIRKNDISPEERTDFIRRAESELARIHSLVRQFVDLGRRQGGQLVKFDARPVIVSVKDMMAHNKAAQGIEITVYDEADRTVVAGRPDQLKQVVINCLFNSIDAINEAGKKEQGQIGIRLDVADTNEEGYLNLEITDNGIGLSREQQQVMFDPFYTTKDVGVGTGLGLAVSQSLIEGFGGRMEFVSEAGKGATMRILIPLAQGNETEPVNINAAMKGAGEKQSEE